MGSDNWNTENAQDYGINLLISDTIRLRELQDDDLPILTQWWNSPEFMALQGNIVLPHPGIEAASLLKLEPESWDQRWCGSVRDAAR